MAYIGVQPADAYTSFAVQHFTTSATDTFTLDYPVANENEIALFINNVRQEPGSSYAYTASGTTLTLSSAITGSDSMYAVFIGKAVQTVTPASGSVTNDMISYPLAKSGATVSTFNRTSSDGDIVELQKDGTTVGSIGANAGNMEIDTRKGAISHSANDIVIYSKDAGHNGLRMHVNGILPTDNTGAIIDNDANLGEGSYRFKDLYLGGNIYLGGTGSANALDDYEEGTWTPRLNRDTNLTSVAYSRQTGVYTKIGQTVVAWFDMIVNSYSGGGGDYGLHGLPFICNLGSSNGGYGIPSIRAATLMPTDFKIYGNSSYHNTNTDYFYFRNYNSSGTEVASSPNGSGRVSGFTIYTTSS